MSRRTEPDPLDEYDPRVAVEWKDKLGQTVRPGDIVAANGYRHNLGIYKVKRINLLGKNGKPFSHNAPTMDVLDIDPITMEPITFTYHYGDWDPNTGRWSKSEQRERVYRVRYPTTEVVKLNIEKS